MHDNKTYIRGIFYLLTFLAAITGVALLKLLASVVIPVMFSLLLALAMLPLIRKLNRRFHVPWNLACVLILVISLVVVYKVCAFLILNINSIVRQIPDLLNRTTSIYIAIAQQLNIPFDKTTSLLDNIVEQVGGVATIQHMLLRSSSYLFVFSKNIILVVFLILFLMMEIHNFRDKIEVAFKGKVKGRVIHASKNIILQITRFISIKFIISLTTGVFVAVGTSLIGLEFSILWGAVAFVLNFIPYFGSTISIIITILFSILQFYPDGESVFFVMLVMFGSNILIGNLIEPNIVGTNLDLSPFLILISLSLWGFIWGFSGMLLAVPATVILKIICANISFLHPLAIFLGNRIQDTQKELSEEDIILLQNPPHSVSQLRDKMVKVEFYFNRLGLSF
nr:AI-2E family transporter [Treponema sp.]